MQSISLLKTIKIGSFKPKFSKLPIYTKTTNNNRTFNNYRSNPTTHRFQYNKRFYSTEKDTSSLFVAISDLDKYGIKLSKFPAIVVTGPQSSGKSSVLEAICGKSILPKKMGMATMKPIHLTTIRDSHARFQIGDREIRNEKEALDELERVNANPSIPKVNVRIHAPDVYNSFLVDLPGLFYVTDEKGADLPKAIKKINVDYIKDPNNIPVVVLAAPTDPATNQALQLVNRHHRQNDSLGIITKVDLTINQSNQLIEDMLTGSKYPLGYGYVAVILRSSNDIEKNISISDKMKDEAKFFVDHFKNTTSTKLNQSSFGSLAMRKRISDIQLDRIRGNIPQLIEEIDIEIGNLKNSESFLTNIMEDSQNTLSMRLKILIEKLVGSSLERAEFEEELKRAFKETINSYLERTFLDETPDENNEKNNDNNNDINQSSKQINPANYSEYNSKQKIDPYIEKFLVSQNANLNDFKNDDFKELFSYGLVSPLLVNSDTLNDAYKKEAILSCSVPLFKLVIDDPMGKKRLLWNNYLRKYFASLLSDNNIQNLVYQITEQKILEYIFKDPEGIDDLTKRFSEYIIREIGSEAYESKIKFSIQAMINTEKRPHVSLLEIVRQFTTLFPNYFRFQKGILGRFKKNYQLELEVYSYEWNRAYLQAVSNQLADNIYRNVSVNLLDRMVEKLLEMTIDMFNKENALKEKNKVNDKIQKLKEIRSIISSFN